MSTPPLAGLSGTVFENTHAFGLDVKEGTDVIKTIELFKVVSAPSPLSFPRGLSEDLQTVLLVFRTASNDLLELSRARLSTFCPSTRLQPSFFIFLSFLPAELVLPSFASLTAPSMGESAPLPFPLPSALGPAWNSAS